MNTIYKGHQVEIKEVPKTDYGFAAVGGGFEYWVNGVNETTRLCPSVEAAEKEAQHFVDVWLNA